MERSQLDPIKPAKGNEISSKPGESEQGRSIAEKEPKSSDRIDDAITLLKNDHRSVEKLFDSYFQATRRAEKAKLAQRACLELVTHATIEEEIFYPACRSHVEDDMMDEAQVEHDAAKVLITELMNGSPEQPFFDAKVKVLSEMIKHHVNEEEKKTDGMFARAKAAGLDVDQLATRMQTRKEELMAEAEQQGPQSPKTHSFTSTTEKESAMHQGHNRNRDGRNQYYEQDENRRSSPRSQGAYNSGNERDTERGYSAGRDRDEGSYYRSSSSSGQGRSSYDNNDGRQSSRSSGNQERERDERGRFVSEDDHDRHASSSRNGDRSRNEDYGRGSHSFSNNRSQYQDRDERGRFMSEDDRNGSSRASSGNGGRSSRDDDDRYADTYRSASSERQSNSSRDNDYGRSNVNPRYEDEDRRSYGTQGRRSSNEYDDYAQDRGQGGWFGDAQGHAEAARRGWRNRD
jgi:hypothetical protein